VSIKNFGLIFCFFIGLTGPVAALASELFRPSCSSILTSDGKISIGSDQDIDLLRQVPLFPTSPGAEVAPIVGPALSGRIVQAEIFDGQPVYVRGEILGSDDAWTTFNLKEQQTGLILKLTAEHPQLGIRRIELIDGYVPPELREDSGSVFDLEDRFLAENTDLKINEMRARYEGKMAWYRKWNGRFLRTTLYDRQENLARLEYLLGLNQIDEALSLLRLDVDNTKVAAITIHKTVSLLAELHQIKSSNSSDQRRIAGLIRAAEKRLKEQGAILGRHYGEYRAYFLKLTAIAKNEKGFYPPHTVASAKSVLDSISVIEPSAALMPNILNIGAEPNLDYLQSAFFAQPYSLEEKLKKDLWAERLTFTWMLINKVTLQDFIRRNLDRVANLLWPSAREIYNSLRKNKRDMDARRFDLPQIERLMHLEGDASAKAEELRKIYFGDIKTALLKSFARLADREERKLWDELKAAAPEDLKTAMMNDEKEGREWGPLSKHYHQDQMNMTAAVMTAAGAGSGFLYYKFGSHESVLWRALDALAQWLPLVN
jgi:hypothetical protein